MFAKFAETGWFCGKEEAWRRGHERTLPDEILFWKTIDLLECGRLSPNAEGRRGNAS